MKILAARGGANVPASEREESVRNPLFTSPLPGKTPAAAAASPLAQKKDALALLRVLLA
jgi:hypothetical protein